MTQPKYIFSSITPAPAEPTDSRSVGRPWHYTRDLVLALLLVLASQGFVLTFERLTQWEMTAAGLTPLDRPLLWLCKEGNELRTNEFCRFDCCWYSSIIRSGYHKEPYIGSAGNMANWNFFPLFPLFAAPWFRVVGMESTKSAVVASNVALYFAILGFLFMVRSKSEGFGDAVLAGTLVAFNPAIIYAHGGYAEPLYFALAATGLALVERKQWIGAGVAGALLSATRMVGVVFGVAYVIAALRSGAVFRAIKDRRLGVVIGALMCPIGLSIWMLFIYHRTGDALASVHIYTA